MIATVWGLTHGGSITFVASQWGTVQFAGEFGVSLTVTASGLATGGLVTAFVGFAILLIGSLLDDPGPALPDSVPRIMGGTEPDPKDPKGEDPPPPPPDPPPRDPPPPDPPPEPPMERPPLDCTDPTVPGCSPWPDCVADPNAPECAPGPDCTADQTMPGCPLAPGFQSVRINCKPTETLFQCAARCNAAGATCGPFHSHPKGSTGDGFIMACYSPSFRPPSPLYSCSYKYPNGDICTVFAGWGPPFLCDLAKR